MDGKAKIGVGVVGALGAMSKRGLPPSPLPPPLSRHRSVRSVDSDHGYSVGRHRSVRTPDGRPPQPNGSATPATTTTAAAAAANGHANGHAANGHATNGRPK